MKGSGLVTGLRNLGTTSGGKVGWVKRARPGGIDGGEGVKEGLGSLLSMSALALPVALNEAVWNLHS